jgi:outer membrane biosynthesis protein TonB
MEGMQRWGVVLLVITGCGFGVTGPDPDRPRSKVPICDTGKGPVVLDGAMAAVAGVVALSLAGDSEPAIALVPLSIGAIYLAGAVRGNSNANKCRRAMGEFESYASGRDTQPSDERVGRLRPPEPEQPAEYAPPVAASSVAPPAPRIAPTPPPAPAPVPAPAQQAPASAPAPAAAPPSAPRPAPAKAAPPAPASDDDRDWSAFWREVE